MKYNKVIAYNSDISVVFELEDGNFALVDLDYAEITVSKYADSYFKFGGFVDAGDIPEKTLKKAVDILTKGEKVFVSRDVKLK